jgi:hypothetical protein
MPAALIPTALERLLGGQTLRSGEPIDLSEFSVSLPRLNNNPSFPKSHCLLLRPLSPGKRYGDIHFYYDKLNGSGFSEIAFSIDQWALITNLGELLDSLSERLGVRLTLADVEETQIPSVVAGSISLTAKPTSLLWFGSLTFRVEEAIALITANLNVRFGTTPVADTTDLLIQAISPLLWFVTEDFVGVTSRIDVTYPEGGVLSQYVTPFDNERSGGGITITSFTEGFTEVFISGLKKYEIAFTSGPAFYSLQEETVIADFKIIDDSGHYNQVYFTRDKNTGSSTLKLVEYTYDDSGHILNEYVSDQPVVAQLNFDYVLRVELDETEKRVYLNDTLVLTVASIANAFTYTFHSVVFKYSSGKISQVIGTPSFGPEELI